MADNEELLRELARLKLQVESKDEELRNKDEELQTNAQRLQDQKERLQETEKELRNTTLEEFLITWHETYQAVFKVEEYKPWLTKGTYTKPTAKKCPQRLRKWEDFETLRDESFQDFCRLVKSSDVPEARLFFSKNQLNGLRKSIPTQPIASEADLLSFHEHTIEDPLRTVIEALARTEGLAVPSRIQRGIIFNHHSNLMNDSTLAETESNQKPISADRFCYGKLPYNQFTLIEVDEQKPPHKLSLEMLNVGLYPMKLDTVINEAKIPIGDDENFKSNATRWVAAAVSQAYGYMLEGGLEFGSVQTGQAIIFLRIAHDDIHTLYYHLAIPSNDAKPRRGNNFEPSLTSLGQSLSFFWMCVRSTPRNQTWIASALESAKRWTVDDAKILSQLTPVKETDEPSPSPLKGRFAAVIAKSIPLPHLMKLRPRKQITRGSCNDKVEVEPDPHEDSDAESPTREHQTPLRKSQRAEGSKSQRRQEPQEKQQRQGQQERHHGLVGSELRLYHDQHLLEPYCTHNCLLGLITKSKFDEACPNVELHRNGTKRRKHLLNQSTFCSRIREQLAKELDVGLTELNLQGARGVLFKVSLLSHGYRFVAKGTRKAYIPHLKHEARVYRRLRPLQGEMVPVHLGSIDLVLPWVRIGLYVVHMLFLSYGGKSINWVFDHAHEHGRILNEMSRLGVEHMDTREPNLLWDEAASRPMVIDFERSELSSRRDMKKAKMLQDKDQDHNKNHGQSLALKKARTSSRGLLNLLKGRRSNIPPKPAVNSGSDRATSPLPAPQATPLQTSSVTRQQTSKTDQKQKEMLASQSPGLGWSVCTGPQQSDDHVEQESSPADTDIPANPLQEVSANAVTRTHAQSQRRDRDEIAVDSTHSLDLGSSPVKSSRKVLEVFDEENQQSLAPIAA